MALGKIDPAFVRREQEARLAVAGGFGRPPEPPDNGIIIPTVTTPVLQYEGLATLKADLVVCVN